MGLLIVATPVGGGQSFTIADGTNRRGAGGKMAVDVEGNTLLAGTDDAVVQESRPLGGAEVERYDRALESSQVPCRVEYEFNAEGEAFAFFFDLQSAVPRLADVTLTLDGQSRTLPRVWLRPLRKRLQGVVVSVDYPLSFGLVASSGGRPESTP